MQASWPVHCAPRVGPGEGPRHLLYAASIVLVVLVASVTVSIIESLPCLPFCCPTSSSHNNVMTLYQITQRPSYSLGCGPAPAGKSVDHRIVTSKGAVLSVQAWGGTQECEASQCVHGMWKRRAGEPYKGGPRIDSCERTPFFRSILC